MNGDTLDQERERALSHPMRRTIFDTLSGGDRTAVELRKELPDVRPVVTDAAPLALIVYHLRVLHRVRLVANVGGLYRALSA